MPRQEYHASPGTLLGQLQRGRGKGYLGALALPKSEASPLLLNCITNDPRIDSQIESRAEYYAILAIEMEFELADVAKYLREHDDPQPLGRNTPLTVGTLAQLAGRNYRDAANILCDYLAWGQWWDWSLDDLLRNPDKELPAKIAEILELRFPTDDELETAFQCAPVGENSWAILSEASERLGAIARILEERRKSSSAAAGGDLETGSMSIQQLLDAVNKNNWHSLKKAIVQKVTLSDVELLKQKVGGEKPFVNAVAFAGLAHLAPPDIFEWMLAFWSSNPRMRSPGRLQARRAILSLSSALTLPRAREWMNHGDWHEKSLAQDILRAHATVEDIPLLRTAIKEALSDDAENLYAICDFARAFQHLPDIGPVPELTEVFVQFRYSFGRSFAAEAIRVTTPDLFRRGFATECLWDCEPATRVLGAKFAPLEDCVALERIRKLASDPCEDEDVCAAAASRLTVSQNS